MAQLYTQVLGFLSVASYDSQGYGGSIRSSLHTEGSHKCGYEGFRLVGYNPLYSVGNRVSTDHTLHPR
jgi:hypothetical protein